ncbi:hexameric tyrosine-coordinated heme protein [Kingella negevensis]|uniref:Hexameric tyrosine-coordinated heme protein (HTHP) n=1 Tax=Kingella negevensis TaxID=1522312 RepID=A0A238HGY7_9NEIS|nr:hexameric tyrosine-coordinated heme protein [Kingella negevensis]MDK4681231.1 hexameric tyrosine-coordinated heme protein [Kingella negevensis]MDK4683428.1 hexameric tyrosine-coordinated heme protein [Kingella negevensis]MDK4685316.1 hexameric tyrosine-coordinated heme protein [Kingella negevensis]MDK4689498.1 hexameric tyrosine-coordinated heme protein [Kingella negevensis]MDK4691437.1 hexameric tyrosine-coordinated heme protein [Kingella negevensis]
MDSLNNSLSAKTIEDGWLIAYRLYQFGVINQLYRENEHAAQVIAQHFATVAAANNYWRNTPSISE